MEADEIAMWIYLIIMGVAVFYILILPTIQMGAFGFTFGDDDDED